MKIGIIPRLVHLESMRVQHIFSFCLFFLAGLPLHAERVQSAHATVELVSDASEIAPGQTFHLGVTFDKEPHWHIYWKNPGASGLAPEFDWDLPAGFEVGAI